MLAAALAFGAPATANDDGSGSMVGGTGGGAPAASSKQERPADS